MTDIVNQTLYEMDKIAAQSISAGSENKIDADAAIQSAGLDKTAENGAGNENEVKARLSGLKDAVLIQIKAKLGDKYDESAVKYLLDSAESTTMSLLKSKNLNSIQNSYIYNSFFSEFNKFYSQYIITNRLY